MKVKAVKKKKKKKRLLLMMMKKDLWMMLMLMMMILKSKVDKVKIGWEDNATEKMAAGEAS